MESPGAAVDEPGYDHRVDPGALALATVAGAVAFIFAGDDWDALAAVIGSLLTVILLAHHRPAPVNGSPRMYLLRGAFGATTGLALCIAVSPVIQYGIVERFFPEFDEDGFQINSAWTTTLVIAAVWPVLALLLAVAEPRFSRWLDRPRRPVTR